MAKYDPAIQLTWAAEYLELNITMPRYLLTPREAATLPLEICISGCFGIYSGMRLGLITVPWASAVEVSTTPWIQFTSCCRTFFRIQDYNERAAPRGMDFTSWPARALVSFIRHIVAVSSFARVCDFMCSKGLTEFLQPLVVRMV